MTQFLGGPSLRVDAGVPVGEGLRESGSRDKARIRAEDSSSQEFCSKQEPLETSRVWGRGWRGAEGVFLRRVHSALCG